MALNYDLGGNTLYVNDVVVGDTTPGSLSGTSISSGITSVASGQTVLNTVTSFGNGSSGGQNTAFTIGSGATTSIGVYVGISAPTFQANKGSLYIEENAATTTSRLWINTTGASTWAYFTTSA